MYSLKPEPEPGGQSGISDGGATRDPRREHALARLPERLLRALVQPEAAGVFLTQTLPTTSTSSARGVMAAVLNNNIARNIKLNHKQAVLPGFIFHSFIHSLKWLLLDS